MKFSGRFCGGLLVGISFGLMLGGFLVERFPALDQKLLIVMPSVLLVVLGVFLAKRGPG